MEENEFSRFYIVLCVRIRDKMLTIVAYVRYNLAQRDPIVVSRKKETCIETFAATIHC